LPELPEITVIANQMNKTLKGKRISKAEVLQPKILNVPVAKLVKTVVGRTVESVTSKGKWLFVKLQPRYFLLINLGMGAELLYLTPKLKEPEKVQFRLTFSDKSRVAVRFWWFGYVHLVAEKDLSAHKMTSALGLEPTGADFTIGSFSKLLRGRKTTVKAFVLDQKNVAGIGNVYAQDILFRARLHPNRKVQTLSETEVKALFNAIKTVLNDSIGLGGLAYEVDFYGRKGKFDESKFLVGYKTGKACPECGTRIEKIKTGSTASYICPKCQVWASES